VFSDRSTDRTNHGEQRAQFLDPDQHVEPAAPVVGARLIRKARGGDTTPASGGREP